MPENRNRLYSDLAWTWQIISPPEEYIAEAGMFVSSIHKYARRQVRTLLDLGCGGGHNDHWLRMYFQVAGVDLSPAMLGLARQLNPDVEYIEGDIRTVSLGHKFDAVVIADAITYMSSEADLRAAFSTAYEHLEPGGVFVTYAEENRENFVQHATHDTTRAQGDVAITFIENYYDPDPDDTSMELIFIYLIRKSGKLEIEMDYHTVGLFPLATWERLLREVGFDVFQEQYPDEDIPVFTCLKPA